MIKYSLVVKIEIWNKMTTTMVPDLMDDFMYSFLMSKFIGGFKSNNLTYHRRIIYNLSSERTWQFLYKRRVSSPYKISMLVANYFMVRGEHSSHSVLLRFYYIFNYFQTFNVSNVSNAGLLEKVHSIILVFP